MKKELKTIYNKIKNKENFAFVRFGDGEQNIMDNVACNRTGFDFHPMYECDQLFRDDLIKSSLYADVNYYKGLDISDYNIFSPRVFVNANYLDFLNNFSSLFEECIFVGNEKGESEHLPFKPKMYFRIPNNAWRYRQSEEVETILSEWLSDKENEIVLVAGGAWSNVLIHKLYLKNPNHIYIDLGSVYDPFLFDKNTRKYHERLQP